MSVRPLRSHPPSTAGFELLESPEGFEVDVTTPRDPPELDLVDALDDRGDQSTVADQLAGSRQITAHRPNP